MLVKLLFLFSLKMARFFEFFVSLFQVFCVKVLQCGPIPNHIAFIMDGNRRYARKKNVQTLIGHSKGYDALFNVLQWCSTLKVKEVTAYAWSIENFKRSKTEIDGIFNLTREKFIYLLSEKEKLRDNGICIKVFGKLDLLPQDLRELIAKLMFATENNNHIILNIAMAYTSREEITTAVQISIKAVIDGDLAIEDISEALLRECMYTRESTNPDLLIRTSGEVRLSDFLLFQTQSTCFYFTEVLWPDFNFWPIVKAVLYYQLCYSRLETVKIMHKLFKQDTSNKNSNKLRRFVHAIATKRRNTLHKYANEK